MKKKILLRFKRGRQKIFLEKAIKKAGSERKLVKLIKIPSASIYAYKKEIQPIPQERAKRILKFLKLNLKGVKKEIISTCTRQWSGEEVGFLLKNYLDMTAREISKKLNRSVESIKHKRRQLNLKKGPKYRWTKEKVLAHFKKFGRELGRTPTYQECSKEAPGMLMAIHLIWRRYSDFLASLGLTTKIRRWTKKECIDEFEKFKKKIKSIPTQENLKKSPGLFRAIIRRWKSYNVFLKELGYKPNFELKWNREECIIEFEKLMKNRNSLLTVEELRKLNYALLAAIYKYFGSYPNFVKTFGYNYDDRWQEWENLVTDICKKIYPNVVIKPRLKNNKQPDVAILENGRLDKIIDAKLNSFAYSIYKDIKEYKPYCKKLEFWCLIGNKNFNKNNIKIVNLEKIKHKLKKYGEIGILNKIDRLKRKWY